MKSPEAPDVPCPLRIGLSLSFFLFFVLLLNAAAYAGLISPELDRIIGSGSSSEDIEVIINLAGKTDILAHSDKDRKTRRQTIVSELRARAELSQVPVRSFLNALGAKKIKPLWIKNAVAAAVPAYTVAALAALPGVESVVSDGVISLPVVQDGAASLTQWNIDRIKAPALWAEGITGSGVVVANMDTGVFRDHPDLSGNYRGGADSWYNPFTDPLNASQCASPGLCSACELSTLPCDELGHGTGTMGVMVAGSSGIGVASGASWIAAKIFNSSGHSRKSIIHQAFQWLLDPDGSPATDDAPDIVNASWADNTAGPCDIEYASDLAALRASGIGVVFAAGNSGPAPATSVSPANNPGAFAVGTTDINNAVASFSSRGPSACDGSVFPHVVAPGVNITLASHTGSYVTRSGTSFSAPHVSGSMALLLSAFPSLTPTEMEASLQQTAFNIGAPVSVPNITYGYGLVDVSRALAYLTTHGNIAVPDIAGFPAAFDYGYIEMPGPAPSMTFTVTNRSGSDLTINSVVITGAHAAEFIVSGDSCSAAVLPPSGSCSLTVTVQAAGAGPRNAAIAINYGSTPTVQTVPLACTIVLPNSVGRFQENTLVATYSVIQSAYDESISGDVIRLRVLTWYENLDLNSSSGIDVVLQGGYDAAFGYQSGFSTLAGTLTVSTGSVVIGNIIVQ